MISTSIPTTVASVLFPASRTMLRWNDVVNLPNVRGSSTLSRNRSRTAASCLRSVAVQLLPYRRELAAQPFPPGSSLS